MPYRGFLNAISALPFMNTELFVDAFSNPCFGNGAEVLSKNDKHLVYSITRF